MWLLQKIYCYLHPLQSIILSFIHIYFYLMLIFTFQLRAAPTLSFASSLLWPLAFPRVWPPSSPRCPSAAPALTAPSPGVQDKGWAPSDLSLRYDKHTLAWSKSLRGRKGGGTFLGGRAGRGVKIVGHWVTNDYRQFQIIINL